MSIIFKIIDYRLYFVVIFLRKSIKLSLPVLPTSDM